MKKTCIIVAVTIAMLGALVAYMYYTPTPQELVKTYIEETLEIQEVDFPTVRFDGETNIFSGVYGGQGVDSSEYAGFTCYLNADRNKVTTCKFGD